jgi:hypothetical protein
VSGRTPSDALANYLEPLRSVIGCVTRSRLTLGERGRLTVNRPYSISLNHNDPVLLRGAVAVAFTFAQVVRVVDSDKADYPANEVSLLEYLYAVSTPEGEELLAFHWTPENPDERARTFPHMHVGRALLGGQHAMRPREFHKIHIPTGGPVQIKAVIRMLIEDFNVTPLMTNWHEILDRMASMPRA